MKKLIPILSLLLMSTPVLAQSGAANSPPAPNAASAAPVPTNSVPAGAENMNTGSVTNPNPSGPVSTTVVTPGASVMPMPAAPTGQQPMANTVPAPASR